MINTTHNVSQKLCHSAAELLRSMSRVPGVEEDVDTSLTLETVTYLLEDSAMLQQGHRGNKMSQELAGKILISLHLRDYICILQEH